MGWEGGENENERARAPRQTLWCHRYACRCLVLVNGNYCGVFAASVLPFSFQVGDVGEERVIDVCTEGEEGGEGGDDGEIQEELILTRGRRKRSHMCKCDIC